MKKFLILLLLWLSIINICFSQDIVDWRGHNRSGTFHETDLLNEWPEDGPRLLWFNDSIYKGYSSASVIDNTVYVTGIKNAMDVLIAIDDKGKVLWKTPYGRAWNNTYAHSRSTPTIEEDRIYVSSGMGDIACINKNSGKIKWAIKATEQFSGTYAQWGIAESILIVDDKIIFTPGGKETTIVALDKHTGKTIWKSNSINDTPAYASPILTNYNNRKIIITVMSWYVFVVDAEKGGYCVNIIMEQPAT
ncbi:MAG: PQQ-binding-like beta-propeller repeat protein [Bacteroidetes bacterium]|nr:PQQ-binding-like beta-propeller repeat protein [Bacteroidota bacterium]